MRITKKGVAVTAITGVLAVGAALPAIGQDATETPSEQATEEGSDRAARRAQLRSEFAAALAEELGIDQARVEEALTAVHERLRSQRQTEARERLAARLDEAVQDGDLTGEQADAILDAFEAGVLPGPGRGWLHHRGFGPGAFPGPEDTDSA